MGKVGDHRARLTRPFGKTGMTVGEALADLELPKQTRLLGYAIHRAERDDFLSQRTPGSDTAAELNLWSAHPNQAQLFARYDEAERVLRPGGEEMVVGIFDTPSQLYVAGAGPICSE